ncbi:MAG: flavin reductase family protein, partial [Runella sp.]
NVREVAEVVINMVDYAMVEQMSLASCEYERGVNEFVKAGFTEVPSTLVKPPRVAESKAAFECKVQQVIEMGKEGGAANLVICEILLAHISEDILDSNGRIDQRKTDWVARLGGDWYVRASGEALFEVPKPNTQKGIGVDAIPDFVKQNPIFSGNDLGRLGNIEKLPSPPEIEDFKKAYPAADYLTLAKEWLSNGQIREAWLALGAVL